MADHQAGRAPPLSVDEVLRAVEGVNWRILGENLIGEVEEDEEMEAENVYTWTYITNLDRIHDENESDEALLRAVVEEFLSKANRSWRRVIWALYCAEEMDKAQQISSYAEPLQDSTLTVNSLVGVMEKVTSDEGRRRNVWERVWEFEWRVSFMYTTTTTTPFTYLDEVYTKYTTDEEKTHALADVYINSRPESSWQHLVQTLYGEGELAAVKEAKLFLQQKIIDSTLTVDSLVGVMEKLTSDEGRRREVWKRVLLWMDMDTFTTTTPSSYLDDVYTKYTTDEEKTHALADTYINGRPESSWQHLVQTLYREGELAAAKEAKPFLQQNDPTLTWGNVTRTMEKVAVDKRRRVWRKVLGERATEKIYSSHSSEEEKLHSCADIYVTYKPGSSWGQLVQELYLYGEMAAAKEAKAFLQQNDPTLTVGNVTRAMEKVTVDNRRQVWEKVLNRGAVRETYSSHSSEEEKLHSCADTYATCKPDSSWEQLVWNLYDCGEMAAAKDAKAFLQRKDPTLTADNVTDVMEKVTEDKRGQVWKRVLELDVHKLYVPKLYVPHSEIEICVDEIYSSRSSEEEKTHACSDMYVNCHPESSWEHLTSLLYKEDEMTAVDKARPFLPPRDLTVTTERLTELFQSVEDPDRVRHFYRRSIGELLGLPQSVLKEIKKSYQSVAKRKEAYLDAYTHHHPCPLWKKISEALRQCRLNQQAEGVKNTYVQVSERTQHNFDIAMKSGTLMIRNGSVFFLGPGGSGKTHTLLALLQELPPSIQQSTPCVKRTVRTIAQYKVGVEGVHFIRIQDDQYSDMLSTTAKQLWPQQPSTTTATPSPVQSRQQGETLEIVGLASSPASTSEHTEETDSRITKQENPEFSPEKKQKIPQSRHSGFERELLRRMQLVPKRSEDLIDKDLIDMKDSGGQPMFHEVLPLFVKNTTFGVLTVKLNERLDSYPMVDYYSNGKPVGEPFPSPFTHLQTFRHCMRVLQSTCSRGTCPKLVFIGTHKDREQECSGENREEKNQKLRNIIPPDLKQSILYYEHSNEELLFAVNVKTPENDDRKMIGYVRQMMIKELHKLPQQKIPLQYFALENAFLRLAKYQHKAILSKEECFREAAAYHFTSESFAAALKYLHGLKLIFYYEEVLPEVVFIDAQTILDKITELVEFSLSLQSKPVHELTISMDIKEFQEFKAYGIITLELLSQFSSHYVPGVFMQQQLVLLLKYLRVIAEVGKGKYLVPCLLKVTSIPRTLPHSASTSFPALLFYFGPNGPKLGVYCCVLASLIAEAKWELMTENDRPVQVSRNQVQFRLPGDDPGAITITDSFSTYLHVSIDFPENIDATKALQICTKTCPSIRETILAAIRRASQKLNYNNSVPKVTFPCSFHLPNDLHPATISESRVLTCTTHPRSVCNELTAEHQLWLGEDEHTELKEPKTMLDQVLDYDSGGVSKHLGQVADSMNEWEGPVAEQLGLSLADISAINKAHPTNLNLQVRAALEKWKQRNGSKATYRKLMVAFEQAGRKDFASKVYEIAGKIASMQQKDPQKRSELATVAAKRGSRPQLAKALKLLVPVAKEWQNIGTILELKDEDLESIATHGDSHSNRLREMLKLWLSQKDSVPSWKALAEAVEPFSDQVAAKVMSLGV